MSSAQVAAAYGLFVGSGLAEVGSFSNGLGPATGQVDSGSYPGTHSHSPAFLGARALFSDLEARNGPHVAGRDVTAQA